VDSGQFVDVGGRRRHDTLHQLSFQLVEAPLLHIGAGFGAGKVDQLLGDEAVGQQQRHGRSLRDVLVQPEGFPGAVVCLTLRLQGSATGDGMKSCGIVVASTGMVGIVLLAGCATPGGETVAGSTVVSSSDTTAKPPTAGGRDTVAACQAGIRMSSSIPPGAAPDDPDPAPQQMKDWAASVAADFEVFAANAPSELAPDVATQRAELQTAQRGERLDVQDPASNKASNAIDAFLFDECGLQRLDVVSADGRLDPIPATLQAAPVTVRFTNTGEQSRAAFVLLVARVKDGAVFSVQDETAGKVDFADVADVVCGVQPSDGQPGYGAFDLSAGRYLVVSVLGTPPEFNGGVDAAEFTVP
jgi:hypothetical protein